LAEAKKQCFVIMPFSKTSRKHTKDYWDAHFKDFLKPLIEEIPQLVAHRSEPLNGDIIRQIIANLVVSPVVVADLTDLNPNVFWELGVRQSFKDGTVTIAQEGTKLPFDIFSKATCTYRDSHVKNEEFLTLFKKAVEKCLPEPENPDSSVLEVVTGRGSLYEIMHHAESLRRMEALNQEQDFNEFLLNKIDDFVKANRDKRNAAEKHMVSAMFSSACTELLITTRYLDQRPEFYKIVIGYFLNLRQLNEGLASWLGKEEHMDKWLEHHMDSSRQFFEEFKKALTEAWKNLSERGSISL
jgi:hypothetical protein